MSKAKGKAIMGVGYSHWFIERFYARWQGIWAEDPKRVCRMQGGFLHALSAATVGNFANDWVPVFIRQQLLYALGGRMVVWSINMERAPHYPGHVGIKCFVNRDKFSKTKG